MTLMLGSSRTAQASRALLLDVAERYQARGYLGASFVWRVTREEIAAPTSCSSSRP